MGNEHATGGDADGARMVAWTCPICGRSEGAVTDRGSSGAEAERYLLQHVRRTDDGRHGPPDKLPDSGALRAPEDCIDEVELGGE